jgi:pimeloyl-ACP methyl ester carboxylesterase
MFKSHNALRLLAFGGALACTAIAQADDKFVAVQGSACVNPPVLHCPDSRCSGPTVINEGPVVEMKTRRQYFLDYPCDLKAGEQVLLVMSLHGGGSYGNWHRNYFPIMDYKEKYRIVIITPNTPTRMWDMAGADDEYLQNTVNFVLDQLSSNKVQVKSFWLAGHSWGGLTANRLLRTDFFKARVDGWLSLSGGRIGGNPGRSDTFAAPRPAGAAPAAGTPAANPAMAAAMTALRDDPPGDFSFIYSTGRREMDDKGLPEASAWATKYGCGARMRRADVVDTKAGYVYDSSQLNNMRPGWGLMPGGGSAEIYEFPKCKDGRIVLDVQRINKGHTEGYEPHITEELVQLMLSAKGGKLQQLK